MVSLVMKGRELERKGGTTLTTVTVERATVTVTAEQAPEAAPAAAEAALVGVTATTVT